MPRASLAVMGYHAPMGVFRKIISVVTAIVLAVTFVGAGFAVCVTPPVTAALSNMFSDDATSPFSRSQLVQVAEATRDYSFGSHDRLALYRTIYDVDLQYKQAVERDGGAVPDDFPKLDIVTDPDDPAQYATAFGAASELYCFSPDTVSHLDDCHAIATTAYPLLAVAAALALIGLVFTGITGRRRKLGAVLLAAGIVVLVAFVALGVWAAVDFAGFFSAFHGILFSQGNWTFPYDSLLICALPTPFWAGMGVVWLAVCALASILSIVIGKKLR